MIKLGLPKKEKKLELHAIVSKGPDSNEDEIKKKHSHLTKHIKT